jgi:(2R)-3-sulfolactate dehydrogenase (NADP+)
VKIPADEARAACARALEACGVPRPDAASTAEVLVGAEMDGVGSHGLSRLPQYVRQLRAGALNPRPSFRWVETRPAAATLHADRALGPVAALAAADAAVERAGAYGVAAIAVRGAGHVGPLAAYVSRVAHAGLVGIAFANTPPAMAPWGAGRPVLGTNPIAFAAPAQPRPVVVDLSLTVAARGKILTAAKTGDPIPEGWAVDAAGRPTTNAAAALGGALLPAGGEKGYALAVMVELLAGALAGGVLSEALPMPWIDPGKTSAPGFLICALAPDAFGGADAFARLAARLGELVAASGGRLPGARRWSSRARGERDGVDVPASLAAELAEAGVQWG